MTRGQGLSSRATTGQTVRSGPTASQKDLAGIQNAEIQQASPSMLADMLADTLAEDAFDPPDGAEEQAEDGDESTDPGDDEDDEAPEHGAHDDDAAWVFSNSGVPLDSPILDLADVHMLRVRPNPDGIWTCSYLPGPGMNVPHHRDSGDAVARKRSGLFALARWFSSEKVAFLAEPTATNLTMGEVPHLRGKKNDQPCVLQSGLLARLKSSGLLDKEGSWTKEDFSRVVPHIWLLWTDKAMPLSLIFEREFQISWASWLCLRGGMGAALPDERLSSPDRELIADVRNQPFVQQTTMETRAIYVADMLSIGYDDIVDAMQRAAPLRQLETQG